MSFKEAMDRLNRSLQADVDAVGKDVKRLENGMSLPNGRDMPSAVRGERATARLKIKQARQQAKKVRKAAHSIKKAAAKTRGVSINEPLVKKIWAENKQRRAEAKEDKAYGDIRRRQQANYRGDSLIDHVKTLEIENKALKSAALLAEQEKPKNDTRIHDEHLTSFEPTIFGFVVAVVAVAVIMLLGAIL